ncbi:hypothetical protein CPB83DRAFT_898749 [Crepidotus variabilis]|uniref:Uncharacterized protein n=1 Tax=Crepidotus variabilis TaxID=179855 RepID=A0A9P6JJN0_9AGAR|nr:hypothetical protein CPB83DRAFT_898749 [Crepidotus variabilis]
MTFWFSGKSTNRDIEKSPASTPIKYPDVAMSSANKHTDGGSIYASNAPTQRGFYTFGTAMPYTGPAGIPAQLNMGLAPPSRPGYMPGGFKGPLNQQSGSYSAHSTNLGQPTHGGLTFQQTANIYAPAIATTSQVVPASHPNFSPKGHTLPAPPKPRKNTPVSTNFQQPPKITFTQNVNPEDMQLVLAFSTKLASSGGAVVRTRSSSRCPRSRSSTPVQQDDEPVRKARLIPQRDLQKDEELNTLREKQRRLATKINLPKEELKKQTEEVEVQKMMVEEREKELVETRKLARKQQEDFEKLKAQIRFIYFLP